MNTKQRIKAIGYFEMSILSMSLVISGCGPTLTPTPTPPISIPLTATPATTPTVTPTPAKTTMPIPTPTPTVFVIRRAQVLDFITSLSNSTTFRGTISGQNCGHGDEITDDAWYQGYHNMIEVLHDKTGEWPGIIVHSLPLSSRRRMKS
jgi:hypothetical protein